MKTITSTYLLGFYKACLAIGARADDLLPLIPGGDKALHTQNQRFSVACISQLLKKTTQITQRQDIGLYVGKYMRPSAFGEAAQALMFCSTLRQAIEIHTKYLHLTQQVATVRLKVVGDEAHFIWKSVFENPEYTRPMAEAALMSQTRIGQWLSWTNDKQVKEVHFRHTKPEYADKYQYYFDCPVLFGQPQNATIIDAALIDIPLPQADEDILAEICSRLDWAVIDLMNTEPAYKQVTRYLKTSLGKNNVSICNIAEHMGMSERSLRRQLALEGTSYRYLLERSRRKLCDHHIAKMQLTFAEIAEKLGYSEQSAFNRAFKKWHGHTPKAYASARSRANADYNMLASSYAP